MWVVTYRVEGEQFELTAKTLKEAYARIKDIKNAKIICVERK